MAREARCFEWMLGVCSGDNRGTLSRGHEQPLHSQAPGPHSKFMIPPFKWVNKLGLSKFSLHRGKPVSVKFSTELSTHLPHAGFTMPTLTYMFKLKKQVPKTRMCNWEQSMLTLSAIHPCCHAGFTMPTLTYMFKLKKQVPKARMCNWEQSMLTLSAIHPCWNSQQHVGWKQACCKTWICIIVQHWWWCSTAVVK